MLVLRSLYMELLQLRYRKELLQIPLQILNKLSSANPTETLPSLWSRDTGTYLQTARAAETVN